MDERVRVKYKIIEDKEQGDREVRRAILFFAAVVFLCRANIACAQENEFTQQTLEILDIGSQKQLLFDDHVILEAVDARRVFHQATKVAEPVIVTNPDEEEELTCRWVMYDERLGRFRMWYVAVNRADLPLCYAESNDGIHWRRQVATPDRRGTERLEPFNKTGIVDPNSTDGGLQAPQYEMAVWYDRREIDPQKRYKMMFDKHESSMHCPAYSADGYSWKAAGETAVWSPKMIRAARREKPDWYTDECNHFIHDPLRNRCIGMMRERLGYPGTLTSPDYFRRIIFYESEDLVHFQKLDGHFTTERVDGAGAQIYWMTGFVNEGVYIGLPTVFYTAEAARESERDRLWICIAFSRDGSHWSWPQRRPFLPRGEEGRIGSGMMFTHSQGVVYEDKIYFYYNGTSELHHESEGPHQSGLGCATLRVDGYASLQAQSPAGGPAIVLTKMLRYQGDRLLVNADARGGEIKVDLLVEATKVAANPGDATQQPPETSDPITGDAPRHVVTWSGNGDLKHFEGVPIRVRFTITGDAKLYSFRFAPHTARRFDHQLGLPIVSQ